MEITGVELESRLQIFLSVADPRSVILWDSISLTTTAENGMSWKALGGVYVTKISCDQSLFWPFTREAQPGTAEVWHGGDKTGGKQAGKQIFSIFRHIVLVLTDITNVSISVYQCIKPGSELSKLLITSTENKIF